VDATYNCQLSIACEEAERARGLSPLSLSCAVRRSGAARRRGSWLRPGYGRGFAFCCKRASRERGRAGVVTSDKSTMLCLPLPAASLCLCTATAAQCLCSTLPLHCHCYQPLAIPHSSCPHASSSSRVPLLTRPPGPHSHSPNSSRRRPPPPARPAAAPAARPSRQVSRPAQRRQPPQPQPPAPSARPRTPARAQPPPDAPRRRSRSRSTTAGRGRTPPA
jgi:hypothetical protein